MQGYESYRRNQILESDPGDILLQLLEGAKVRLGQARELWNEGQKIIARERRQQALQIIISLDSTLDRENYTEVVENLDALYAYMMREISNSTQQDDFERLVDVEEVLGNLHEGFKDAVAEYKGNQQSASPSVAEQGQGERPAERLIGAG